MHDSSQKRSQVMEYLFRHADYSKAIELSETIDEPWFQCQSFALCARFANPTERQLLINKAFVVAENEKDENQVVSASAWPLSVLCDYGEEIEVKNKLLEFFSTLKKLENPVQVLDAVELLLLACARSSDDVIFMIIDKIMTDAPEVYSWKHDRYILRARLILGGRDEVRAEQLKKLLRKPSKRFNNSQLSDQFLNVTDQMFGRVKP